jgi:hypothetical protein
MTVSMATPVILLITWWAEQALTLPAQLDEP